jgi:hypothetical protein
MGNPYSSRYINGFLSVVLPIWTICKLRNTTVQCGVTYILNYIHGWFKTAWISSAGQISTKLYLPVFLNIDDLKITVVGKVKHNISILRGYMPAIHLYTSTVELNSLLTGCQLLPPSNWRLFSRHVRILQHSTHFVILNWSYSFACRYSAAAPKTFH